MRKTLIQRKEVGAGGAASIEFTNIPQTYTDLYLVFSIRTNRSSNQDTVGLNINGVSTNRTYRRLRGSGSAASSASGSTTELGFIDGNTATSNTFGNGSMHIPNYTASQNKVISADSVDENNATAANQAIYGGLWSSTDAITSLELVSLLGTGLLQYSSASLYGVSKYNVAGGSPKATGGIISYDSTTDKWVHVFTASGTFTPSENLTAEYLVVAGGGGGGDTGGGGGAGGYRSSVSGESSGGGASAESALSLTASTGYTVTVGAGGAGGVISSSAPTAGSNSTFDTITSTGGGRAGTTDGGFDGGTGGSGGGGKRDGSTGGSGTTDQGYDGGAGASTPFGGAGGGGGAGAVGGNGAGGSSSTEKGGDGGAGVQSSITGTAIYRAGGGGGGSEGDASIGGGAGGIGGGGAGSKYTTSPDPGLPATGGGGGGVGSTLANGAKGGSGIVIVRYSA